MDEMRPFLSVKDTCKATGISIYAIRKGIEDGSIPHVKRGNKFYINVNAYLEALDKESRGGCNAC